MNLHLTLDMPSHPCFLSVVRSAVDELSGICDLSSEECNRVTLAVDEALANIIRHAYKSRYDQKIHFDCFVDEEKMVFTMLDQGEPPDMRNICAESTDELALSGRGTHLIKAIMDEVCYKRVSEGNQLTLIKRLPSFRTRANV